MNLFPKFSIVVSILFLYSLTVNGLFDCDKHKNCICNGDMIDCVQSHLKQVPFFSPFVVKLNLSYNLIKNLNPYTFGHLSLLNHLDLSYNHIEKLQDFIFSGLANLKTLHLNHNRIRKIRRNSFKNLHELQQLHLEGNHLLQLDGDVFFDLSQLSQLSLISFEDDRRQLCSCKLVQTLWNVQDEFSFCSKIDLSVGLQLNPVWCKQWYDNMTSNTSLHNTIPMVTNIVKNNLSNSDSDRAKMSPHLDKLSNKSNSSPIFSIIPHSPIRAKAGSILNLQCIANGHPEPSIKWVKSTTKQILSTSQELILNVTSTEDEDVYECWAENNAGIAVKEFKVIVLGHYSMKNSSSELRSKLNQLILNDDKLNTNQLTSKMLKNITEFIGLVKLLMRDSDNGMVFDSTKHIHFSTLTPVNQMVMNNYTSCVGGSHVEVVDCRLYAKHRAISGICNNLKQPLWGSSQIPFVRLLPSIYEDNLAKPVGWFANRKYQGYSKPSARTVTEKLLSSSKITADPNHNHLLMQFGQFLDHDLVFTALSSNVNLLENDILDCRQTCSYVEPCFSVSTLTDDRNSDHADKCIEVVRSAEYCGTGFTSIVFGHLNPREQMNQLTAFIDGSQIYGSNSELAQYLRILAPNEGLLKTVTFNGKQYLPLDKQYIAMDCQLRPSVSFLECFLAGDHRANEQIGLLIFHNLWVRHHNNLARKLRIINPHWSGERIYQESRKIVGAQLQIITYRDWLPTIIGSKGLQMLGEYRSYNSSLNPSIFNAFSTAAMRFGHTLINKNLVNQYIDKQKFKINEIGLKHAFFAPHLLLRPNVSDSVLLGLMRTPLKKPKPEQAINSQLTNHLFEQSRYVPLDLASINIQRGRDHALPGYNAWRSYCGLNKATTFENLRYEIPNKEIRQKLSQLYGHPDNIDLWVGGILEQSPEDAKVGPTFRCLLVEQFRNLRDGDRFFYKNKELFSEAQLVELEKTTLGNILCQNGDNIHAMLPNSFSLPQNQKWVNCEELANLDLEQWVESL